MPRSMVFDHKPDKKITDKQIAAILKLQGDKGGPVSPVAALANLTTNEAKSWTWKIMNNMNPEIDRLRELGVDVSSMEPDLPREQRPATVKQVDTILRMQQENGMLVSDRSVVEALTVPLASEWITRIGKGNDPEKSRLYALSLSDEDVQEFSAPNRGHTPRDWDKF